MYIYIYITSKTVLYRIPSFPFADGFPSGYQLAETDLVGTLLVVVDGFTRVYGGRDERVDQLGTARNAIFFGRGVPERPGENGEDYRSER